MALFEGRWRFNLAEHKRFGISGTKRVEAPNEELARSYIQQIVAKQQRVQQHIDNVCVYDVAPVQ